MAELALEGVNKNYGSVIALQDFTLRVEDKEFITLLGPSGCGKTTTLKIITGLETPDSGSVYIDGKPVNEVPPEKRDVAMVFQNYALYPLMSVFDNMAFALKMRKYPKEEIRRKVKATAELLRVDHLLERKPKQLSGGEAQRVALGRAIVREPKIFLMDEPLSNLDAKLRVYMRAELKQLQHELQVTTVYVTHDQIEAMTMSNRIALMNNGKLVQLGTPDELYLYPSNLFTAGFVGSLPMNFVDGSLKRDKKRLWFEGADFTYDLTEFGERIGDLFGGSEAVLGIRPEDILLYKGSADDTITGKIQVVEPLGDSIIVTLSLGKTNLKAKTDSDFSGAIGDEARLVFKKERLRLFDKKNDSAILRYRSNQ